jgi:TP901 family phage tail tape measure protein
MAFQEVFGIGAIFTFKNVASAEIRRARADVEKLKAEINGMKTYNIGVSKAITTAASGIKYFFGGAAAFFGPMLLAGHASNFAEKMLYLKQVTGSSDEEMKALEAQAIKTAQTTKFSAAEAAWGMYQIASAGYSGAQASKMLGSMLDYTTVSGTELGETIRDVTSIMHQYNVKAEHANKVTSAMIKLQDLTMFNYDEIGRAMASSAGAAVGMGQGLSTVMALVGSYRNLGIKAAEAGMKVKTALTFMKNTKPRGILESLGIQVYNKKTGYKNIIDILAEYDAKMTAKGYNAYQKQILAQEIWGPRSQLYNAYLATSINASINGKDVTLYGKEAIKYLEQQLKLAEESNLSQKRAEEQMGLVKNQWKMLTNTAETFLNAVGKAATPTTLEFLKNLHGTIEGMAIWAQNNPKIVSGLTSVVMTLGKFAIFFGMFKFGLGALQYLINLPSGIMLQWGNLASTAQGVWGSLSAWGTALKFAASQGRGLGGTLMAIGKTPIPGILQGALWIAAIGYASRMIDLMFKLHEINTETDAAEKAADASAEKAKQHFAEKYGIKTTNPTSALAMAAGVNALADAVRRNPKLSEDEKNSIVNKAMAGYITSTVQSKFPGSQFVMGWSDDIGFTTHWGGKESPEAREFEGQALQGLNAEDFSKILRANPITVNVTIDGQKVFSVVQTAGKEEAERAGTIIKEREDNYRKRAASLAGSSGRNY